MNKRLLDIAVISDLHLGSSICHTSELLTYLKSIDPTLLILNGDIIDKWDEHAPNKQGEVINYLLKMAQKGKKVYYLLGNHDKSDPKNNPLMNNSIIVRKHLELVIDQKKYWIFHGDIFDSSVTISPIFAKLGLLGYRNLIRINRFIHSIRTSLGMSRLSLAGILKRRLTKARKYVRDFERLVCKQALKKEYDVVICGHIHVPVIKTDLDSDITYMNAGDWVENLTALEYQSGRWNIHSYDPTDYPPVSKRLQVSRKVRAKNHSKKPSATPANKKKPLSKV